MAVVSGAGVVVGWTRGAQILLTRNEHYFRGPVHFEHVIVRHMGDSATQLLAIRRGDIGAAFNLIPEQIATLKGDKDVRVEKAFTAHADRRGYATTSLP